ncbi:hypothetical protein SAMN05444671_3856 [Flavobacterium sp. CF108]|uniref:hypothetical protein n=1 Tax=unclassified Flavobacterium TaxID=196869 RepID=UPI0008B51740|nr:MULTISPECIES: hypothetical protein [unclassified Flavobacterium]SEO96747.1 hypothetical protein SAMN04487978_4115 [Flavobacterium sp. fv08]SHH81158.1 hypothetical protein SAMN05444671_3856 [Flavobacterium sp. CF108]
MKNILKSIPFSTIIIALSLIICSFSKQNKILEAKQYKIVSIDSLIGFEYSNLPIDSMFDENNVAIRSKVYDLNDTVVVYRIIIKTENMKEKLLLITRKNNCNNHESKRKIEVGKCYKLDLYDAMGPAPITVNCLDYFGQEFCRSKKDSIFEIKQTTSLEGIYLNR